MGLVTVTGRGYTSTVTMNNAHETARVVIAPAAPRDRSVASDMVVLVLMLVAGPPGAFWVTLVLMLRRRTAALRPDTGQLLPQVVGLLPEPVPVPVPVEDTPRP